MADARTTEAAKSGPGKALPVAFRGGAVMGFSVAGPALLGLMITYILFVTVLEVDQAFEIVTAYGLGASTIALFSRVGDGIFTKAADVGADLVGKVEAGIPETSLREMIIPGSLAVVVPLVVGFIGVDALGGLLAGALVTGFALAIFMANSGSAWDNAKKYIEAGAYGGEGSDPHEAAVVGDTVGDPFEDTSGPSMNILIQVMTIVSLVFASAFVGVLVPLTEGTPEIRSECCAERNVHSEFQRMDLSGWATVMPDSATAGTVPSPASRSRRATRRRSR